jgi:hypothetical protein
LSRALAPLEERPPDLQVLIDRGVDQLLGPVAEAVVAVSVQARAFREV